MTTTVIDLSREYFSGMNAPAAEQAGAAVVVDDDGPNFRYSLQQQVLAGSGAWDGESQSVAVTASGARTITMADPAVLGTCVEIIDAAGNAGAGNITINPDGATTINGAATLVLSTNYASARLRYVAAGSWVRVQG